MQFEDQLVAVASIYSYDVVSKSVCWGAEMWAVAATLDYVDLFGRELLLFAGVWFAVGLVDEIAVDILWLCLRIRGHGKAAPFHVPSGVPLRGPAAVLIPAWHEATVIEQMIRSCRAAWPHRECSFYVGCYPNDPDTIAAAKLGAGNDGRVSVVVLPHHGPTTKADCLNGLYDALARDEIERGQRVRFVVLHDAEDRVHPLALNLMDDWLEKADFVQLPVIPELNPDSRWISGHYADEFAESHMKTMVVRDWLDVALPAAGVGCAFEREILARIAEIRGAHHPFAPECLTEDYELGLLVHELGGRSRFVRAIDPAGHLIATREFFPATINEAVRQKSRWIQGIAFQGWDRLGWSRSWAETWMRLRDRRGPLTAVILLAAYLVIVVWAVTGIAQLSDLYRPRLNAPLVELIVAVGLVGVIWRGLVRSAFSTVLYGLAEGLRSVARMPIANLITIVAARRALVAYLRTLRGGEPVWEKTSHYLYPVKGIGPSEVPAE
jgi:adsorption protein B